MKTEFILLGQKVIILALAVVIALLVLVIFFLGVNTRKLIKKICETEKAHDLEVYRYQEEIGDYKKKIASLELSNDDLKAERDMFKSQRDFLFEAKKKNTETKDE